MVDMEHGPYNLEAVSDIIRMGRVVDMCPLVRVASPEYHLITGPLDMGAMGIMMPRIETRDEVEEFVACMKYPPLGKRGCSSDAPHSEYDFGPLSDFISINNEDTLVIAQLEKFQNVRPASTNLPGYVEGKITPQPSHSGDLEPASLTLAIAVNGIIRTTTRGWKVDEALNFLCRLPPESFREGANEIGVYGVESNEEGRVESLISFAENQHQLAP